MADVGSKRYRFPEILGVEIRDAAMDDHALLLTSVERTAKLSIAIQCGTYINRYGMIGTSEKLEIEEDHMIGPYCCEPPNTKVVGAQAHSIGVRQ